jgi:hypothetical protein
MVTQILRSRWASTGSRAQRLLIGIAVVAPVLVVVSAVAAPPMTGLPESARLVSDEELGEMRGRYIAPESVNFFGIQLVSTWQTGDGNVLTASLEFETDVAGGNYTGNPHLWANVSHDCTPGTCDESLDLPLNAGIPAGLNSVNGAVQTTSISGTDNDARNVMQIRIGDYDASSVGYEGNGKSMDVPATGLTVELPDGFIVKFSKGDNSLGMLLQGPGDAGGHQAEGIAYQGINGDAINQIAQHVEVIGNANAINNTLDVVIGIDQLQTTQVAVENALSSMKGWGF